MLLVGVGQPCRNRTDRAEPFPSTSNGWSIHSGDCARGARPQYSLAGHMDADSIEYFYEAIERVAASGRPSIDNIETYIGQTATRSELLEAIELLVEQGRVVNRPLTIGFGDSVIVVAHYYPKTR